ncbi:GL18238 [Drosophila persimilis]|uniref:Translation initiation factor IF-2 n=2 Tax=pseudoobscura subgroup TaxID=32358 RepID=Q29I10_DROPS|nr:translation initiation factor IF-2 [Drosophila pseudoobscura]EDW32711.1 GL18238 [Drosophila persimilis]
MQAHKISHCLALVLLSLSQIRGQIIQPIRYPGGPVHPQRQQRSLFGPPGPPIGWSSGGGWAGPSPSFGFSHLPPSSSPHVTKDELLALLAAWKDVEPKPTPSPPPEPEDEPEPEVTTAPPPEEEEEPEPEPEAPAPAPEAPAGPPPGVPVTVSLPALVPIQLAAMWQTPVPGAGSVGLGLGGIGGLSGLGLGLGGGVAAAAASTDGGAAAGAAAATARTATVSRSRARARVGGRPSKAASIRFPVANPRSFASGNYVAPRPRYYRAAPSQSEPSRVDVMPSPGYLAHVPGPVQLVPGYWQ